MDELLHKSIEKNAETALELLDIDAKMHQVKRSDLLELFIDTINAMNQNKEQED